MSRRPNCAYPSLEIPTDSAASSLAEKPAAYTQAMLPARATNECVGWLSQGCLGTEASALVKWRRELCTMQLHEDQATREQETTVAVGNSRVSTDPTIGTGESIRHSDRARWQPRSHHIMSSSNKHSASTMPPKGHSEMESAMAAEVEIKQLIHNALGADMVQRSRSGTPSSSRFDSNECHS